jgi:hypothetical protein
MIGYRMEVRGDTRVPLFHTHTKSMKVITYAMHEGLDKMLICATNAPFMTSDEVAAEVKRLDEANFTPKRVAKEMASINSRLPPLEENTANWSFWSTELLEAIDQSARQRLGNCPDQIGVDTSTYDEAITLYSEDVCALLKQHHPNNPDAAGKFAWLMQGRGGFPIITNFVIDSVVSSWGDLSNALHEVSGVTSTHPRSNMSSAHAVSIDRAAWRRRHADH